jgi:hypothetical protein
VTRLLLLASGVCFLLALLVALGADIGDTTVAEWTTGGLLAYVLDLLLGPFVLPGRARV